MADNIQRKPERGVFSLGKKNNLAGPSGRNTGYELKMTFKYVSESQQKPVTIKRAVLRVLGGSSTSSHIAQMGVSISFPDCVCCLCMTNR